MHRRLSCGVFFCLSVLCHNRSCKAVSAALRHSGAWPPPPHLGGHIRNAPCINYQVCARGVFRSLSARPFISMLLSGMKCPGFQHIWAKTRENGAFYGSRPVGNAGESICFRDSVRQTGIYRIRSSVTMYSIPLCLESRYSFMKDGNALYLSNSSIGIQCIVSFTPKV